jgi:predicted negative regulator of RcsB-dependent stress response
MNSLINFFDCVLHLGFKAGYNYWKINQDARKRPEVALEIAEALERASEECEGKVKESTLDFAKKCRESYAKYMKKTS